MTAIDWLACVMADKDQKYFKELGARLAAARKVRGMTQFALAAELGIAQQTLGHYEVGRARPSVTTLVAMSQILRFSLDEMLLGSAPRRPRPGPASKLELQMLAVTKLPKAKQRFVSDMLETVLTQQRSG